MPGVRWKNIPGSHGRRKSWMESDQTTEHRNAQGKKGNLQVFLNLEVSFIAADCSKQSLPYVQGLRRDISLRDIVLDDEHRPGTDNAVISAEETDVVRSVVAVVINREAQTELGDAGQIDEGLAQGIQQTAGPVGGGW